MVEITTKTLEEKWERKWVKKNIDFPRYVLSGVKRYHLKMTNK